jgi:hypothetical protein
MAPVTAFCVLISVFVIAIGPVNYWLLRRRRQLHLLLLTIPASAAVITVLLFGYALVADGLDVRVRARSLTHLDQHSGRAVCWTRLSYFAGLSPRGGLRFSADTAVFPLEQVPREGYQEAGLFRELAWDEEQQQLASGWLASRTPTQFLTVRARPSSCGLDLLDPAGAEKAPSVRNRLQTAIQQLVVRTKEGKYYQAASVGAGATVMLEPISAAADARLTGKLRDDKLLVPPGMADTTPTGAFGRVSYRMWLYNQGSARPSTATSRLEKMRSVDNMPPGSYAALVDRSPEVVLGVSSPREEPSSHVILGQW